jgi:hypothetical protein
VTLFILGHWEILDYVKQYFGILSIIKEKLKKKLMFKKKSFIFL